MVAEWDVAVVGAGPGGLSAAHAAASAGARTIVLERAEHPRYKTCGGGLIGTSLGIAAPRIEVPARDTVTAITFTDNGRRAFTRRSRGAVLTMVRRDDFDHAWYEAAVSAGAHVRQHAQVRAIGQDATAATVTLADGETITARTVIGADGSAGVSSRHVGVTFAQQDLGLEVELAATPADRAAYRGRVLLDWGPVPGSYGWVFPKTRDCEPKTRDCEPKTRECEPKTRDCEPHGAGCRSAQCWSEGDELTVGVIMAKGQGAETKEYLARFRAQLGLVDRPVVRDSGHLTRCRDEHSPLRRGRVMVAGDAAGLLEPWTREGISFALRSGTWAGQVAARARTPAELSEYDQLVTRELAPEMAAGRRLLQLFVRHPHLVHAAMATPPGWRAFQSFSRGDLSMAQIARHPAVRIAATFLARPR